MSNDFTQLTESSGGSGTTPNPLHEVVASLGKQLEAEKDGRKEDRFIFIVVFLICVDVHIFKYVGEWAGIVCIFILQLVILLILAKNWGIEHVQILLDKALGSISGRHNN